MRFSVASWHTRPVAYWLAHGAYTTMASPPRWAKEQGRNEPLFVPPSHIVFGDVSQDEYTAVYRQVMQRRLPQIRQWMQQHQDDHMILLCACPDGKFCHRLLIAKLLTWLKCEEVPLPEEDSMARPDGSFAAISLWQPWASLIAIGAKTIETRSWAAPKSLMGQRIAIHAAKKWNRELEETCLSQPFYDDLHASGMSEMGIREYLPQGAVLCTARLVACRSTNDDDFIEAISEREYDYGNYAPDRYAWILDDVQVLPTPLPYRGAQGIFTVQMD